MDNNHNILARVIVELLFVLLNVVTLAFFNDLLDDMVAMLVFDHSFN